MKCFVLEYFVQKYAVPINSKFYIWFLSIFMATVATIVYSSLQMKKTDKSFSIFSTQSIVICYILGAFLFSLITVFFLPEWQIRLPFLLSLSTATLYLILFFLQHRQMVTLISALAWYFGAFVIGYLADDPFILIIFASLIFAFTIVPTVSLMFQRQREIDDALSELNS